MNTPLVSVIVPVFNGERFLRESLRSVIAQSYRNIEIIATCVPTSTPFQPPLIFWQTWAFPP